MKFLISPAKSLDFTTNHPNIPLSTPVFSDKAVRVMSVLKKKKPEDLGALMGISTSLSNLNYQRNQTFCADPDPEMLRPAVLAFTGDVYQGLDAGTLSESLLSDLNDQGFILSGLYGVLKPFDGIQPYRLEMGTKLPVGTKANMVQYWKKPVTDFLHTQVKADELLVNLASQEYSAAVDFSVFIGPVVHPVFLDDSKGQLKVISFFAKKARGLMVRYLVESNAQSLTDVCGFQSEGYRWSESMSQDPMHPVFVR